MSEIETSRTLFGYIPKLPVIENWGDWVDDGLYPFVPCVRYGMIFPGDVIPATACRGHYNLPQNNMTGMIWRKDEAGIFTNACVFRRDYKSSDSLRVVQEYMDHSRELRKSGGQMGHVSSGEHEIETQGSGGSSRAIGDKPVSLVNQSQMIPPSLFSIAHNQSVSSELNHAMCCCDERDQTMAVFATPQTYPPGLDAGNYVQFLGIFAVNGHAYTRKTKEELDEILKNSTENKSKRINHTFKAAKHFSFKLKEIKVDYNTVLKHTMEDSQRIIELDVSSGVAKHFVKYPLYEKQDDEDLMKKLIDLVVDRELVAKVIMDSCVSLLLQEQFGIQVDDLLENMEPEDEGDIGEYDDDVDASKEVQYDHQISYEKKASVQVETVPKMLGNKKTLFVDVAQTMDMMVRIAASVAFRSIGAGITTVPSKKSDETTEMQTCGYLLDQKQDEALGCALQSSPSPSPIRLYDVGTGFFVQMVLASLDSFRCDGIMMGKKGSHQYVTRQDICSVSACDLHWIILTSIVVRCLGQTEQLRLYLTKVRSNADSWQRLFTSSDIENLPLFIIACARCGSGNEMNPWISGQFRNSVPDAAKGTAKVFQKFLKAIGNGLENVVVKILTKANVTKEECCTSICTLLLESSDDDECPRSLLFVAGQIIADLEEVLRGKNKNDALFGGCFQVLGHGGKEGFHLVGKSMGFPTRPLSKDVTETQRIRYKEGIEKTSDLILDYAKSRMTDEELLVMGLWKDKSCEGQTIVRIIGNARALTLVDTEHMMCKLYLLLQRYRGTRYYSTPLPWRSHCHGSLSKDVYNKSQEEIMMNSAAVFTELVSSGDSRLSPLQAPFTLVLEVDE